ncbi:MAG: MogA/MoaB family molybdenum cofactor biosynthesis protein [Phycisphaerales bacterium]|nr:MogA/MoaB family molybdenum cofactor biosynthesis protein [Phycisphaerales bacterium]
MARLPSQHQDRIVSGAACGVLTVSDTRTQATDAGGALVRELLVKSGHRAWAYEIVRDEPDLVAFHVSRWCEDAACDAVLVTGGTGFSARDTTYEAISALLERRMDGFGELFRSLSFQEIGAAAMLSRALAGVRGGTAVFSMPGSPAAVRLAMEKLILPTLGHLVWLLRH